MVNYNFYLFYQVKPTLPFLFSSRQHHTPFRGPSGPRNLLFSAASPAVFFRSCHPCRGQTHEASRTPDCGLTALSGVTKISSLRDELFFRNLQKHDVVPKSHAALRFLPLRNCVVSSVKKRELSEATRNGMQCCKFSRFSEKRPILGKNRAAEKAHFFSSIFFGRKQRKWTNITEGINSGFRADKTNSLNY